MTLIELWQRAGEPWREGMSGALSMGLRFRLAGRVQLSSIWHANLPDGAMASVDMRHPSYTVEPDLTDPATLGALLGVLREIVPGAHAEPNGAAEWDGGDETERDHWWRAYRPGGKALSSGPTEAHALLLSIITYREPKP